MIKIEFNTNTKLIILVLLVLTVVISALYQQGIQKELHHSFQLYEKTANSINIIKELKTHYGDKKTNKREVYNIINPYNAKITSKKEDKNSIEFTVGKLNFKELDTLNKMLFKSGLKVIQFSVKRVDPHTAELFCKVLF